MVGSLYSTRLEGLAVVWALGCVWPTLVRINNYGGAPAPVNITPHSSLVRDLVSDLVSFSLLTIFR